MWVGGVCRGVTNIAFSENKLYEGESWEGAQSGSACGFLQGGEGFGMKSSRTLFIGCLTGLFFISCGQFRTIGDYKPGHLNLYKGIGGFLSQGSQGLRGVPSSTYSPKGKFYLSWPVEHIQLTQEFAPPPIPLIRE